MGLCKQILCNVVKNCNRFQFFSKIFLLCTEGCSHKLCAKTTSINDRHIYTKASVIMLNWKLKKTKIFSKQQEIKRTALVRI